MHAALSVRSFLLAACLVLPSIALLAAPAGAVDLPKRKSGLWEIKTGSGPVGGSSAKAAGATVQMCIDEKTDNAIQQQAGAAVKHNCSKQDMKKSGGQIVVDSVCKFGETTAVTHSVFTGSFDSAYRVETKSTYTPPLMGMKEGDAVIEARWLGPCKPDQKPGDMILGNGMKVNLNDAKGGPRVR